MHGLGAAAVAPRALHVHSPSGRCGTLHAVSQISMHLCI